MSPNPGMADVEVKPHIIEFGPTMLPNDPSVVRFCRDGQRCLKKWYKNNIRDTLNEGWMLMNMQHRRTIIVNKRMRFTHVVTTIFSGEQGVRAHKNNC